MDIMDGEIVFEGSIKHTFKKKTKRAKLKLIIKKLMKPMHPWT